VRLQPFERRWAGVIAQALVPADALDGATDGIDFGARYDDECARSPWHAALLMRASLWLTWLAPVWLYGRAHTFGSLEPRSRVAVLERLLGDHRYTVRMTAMFLKLIVCTLLLGDPATLAQLGAYRLTPPSALTRRSAS
jgi:hypothetical protein